MAIRELNVANLNYIFVDYLCRWREYLLLLLLPLHYYYYHYHYTTATTTITPPLLLLLLLIIIMDVTRIKSGPGYRRRRGEYLGLRGTR